MFKLKFFISVAFSIFLFACASTNSSGRKPAGEPQVERGSMFEVRIVQPISHFENGLGTFSQRIFVNSKYVKDGWDHAPVFLLFCGESACDKDLADTLEIKNNAEKMGAHIVTLEHRYYGESRPFEQLTKENLRFLNVKEALADAEKAQKYLQTKFNLKGEWIGVGCSYAGSLAAFYHNNNPHALVGSIVYSGAVVEDKPYRPDPRIRRALGPACYSNAQKFLREVERDLKNPGKLERMRSDLGLDRELDARVVLDAYYTLFTMAAQYDLSAVVCEKLTQKEPAQLLAQQLALISDNDSSKATLEGARFTDANHPWNKESGSGVRQFIYQACTELNVFPEDNAAINNLRPRSLNQKYFESVCKKYFGVSAASAKQRAEFQDEYANPLASSNTANLFFVEGEFDPFADLALPAKAANEARNVEILEVAKGGHCAGFQEGDKSAAELRPKLETWLERVFRQKK